MRLLNLLLAGLIVVAGLIGALFLMALGFISFVLRRLFGQPAPAPTFQWSARVNGRQAGGQTRRTDPNVIDVVATEVKDAPSIQDSRSNTNR